MSVSQLNLKNVAISGLCLKHSSTSLFATRTAGDVRIYHIHGQLATRTNCKVIELDAFRVT